MADFDAEYTYIEDDEDDDVSPNHLWEKPFDGEKSDHFARFKAYLYLDTTEKRRSLRRAYQAFCREHGKTPKETVPGNWADTSKRFKWKYRADAYDKAQLDLQNSLDARARLKKAQEWAAKRETLREEKWAFGVDLKRKAETYIRSNHIEWKGSDILKMVELAFKLGDEAAGSEVNEIKAIQVLIESGVLPPQMQQEINEHLHGFYKSAQGSFIRGLLPESN